MEKKLYFRSQMQHITDIFERMLHWLFRFRHRKGYGIHSPFAFSFVTGVVYEDSAYYAYERLGQLSLRTSALSLRRKDCKLLFRLANFAHPQRCYLQGIRLSDPVAAYIKAGSVHTQYANRPCPAGLVVAAADWTENADQLLDLLQPGGMLILFHVGKNRQTREAWKKVQEAPQAQVTFNLRDFGIVFYRPELQREHYVINYF